MMMLIPQGRKSMQQSRFYYGQINILGSKTGVLFTDPITRKVQYQSLVVE